MTDSSHPGAPQDESAVAAVRGGDTERYRELVERHERRVFAVAWSRLGDAALAEEATQEAFIRAYRRLWLLGDGAKFAGWVSPIARRVAINLGLRHRRELNKRERWALENFPVTALEKASGEDEALCTPETLRQTLAELPAGHRECLVLYYLEGKSGAEAAVVLGISEAALRVRLHRARAVMRERLEEKLAGSLAQLRPAKTLVPAIMAGVLASSSAKAATAGGIGAVGVGAKILSVLGKTFLFSWFVPLFSLLVNLPSLAVVSVIGRKERENFRDAEGFRPELHCRFFRSFMWGFPVLLVVFFLLNQSVLAAWGIQAHQFALAGFSLMLVLISGRSLVIARNPYQLSMFAYCVIIAAGLSALALGWIPQHLASLPLLTATIVLFLFYKRRPMRMDYNLCLRAAQGLLRSSVAPEALPPTNQFNRCELLAFGRFLGAHFLASNFSWEAEGLALRLPPVRSRFLANMAAVFLPPGSRNCSRITLRRDGTVTARCGKTDASDLAAMTTSRMASPRELEVVVAETVGQAWRGFRAGSLPAAARWLGELPESEVFVVPPARARAMRWWRLFIGASIALMMPAILLPFWHSAWLDGLKPVNLTEAQVRQFLSLVNTNPNPVIDHRQPAFAWDPCMPLFSSLVLPGTNLFTPRGIQAVRDTVAGDGGFEAWRNSSFRAQSIFNAPLPARALTAGWLSWNDLGIGTEDAAAAVRTNHWMWMNSREHWDYFLAREKAWSWVKQQRFEVMQIQLGGLTDLQLLHDINCLDLIDREKLIQQIASAQILSSTPPGQPPLHDWKDMRGLFFTPCYPALQDTYYALAALQILGGLDRIDREQCVRGILRVHRGKGFFTSPESGGFNEYHIEGDAQDTIAAFESLRILSALDQVKDLDQWKFRPQRRRVAANEVTWRDIEAWVAQQRLEKILREHKQHPSAPFRSLLEP